MEKSCFESTVKACIATGSNLFSTSGEGAILERGYIQKRAVYELFQELYRRWLRIDNSFIKPSMVWFLCGMTILVSVVQAFSARMWKRLPRHLFYNSAATFFRQEYCCKKNTFFESCIFLMYTATVCAVLHTYKVRNSS